MRKPRSNWTQTEFIEVQAALGLSTNQLAHKLRRNHSTISCYAHGHSHIPYEVEYQMTELLKQRRDQVAKALNTAATNLTTHNLITYTNEERMRAEPRSKPPALCARKFGMPEGNRLLGVYRLNHRKLGLYIRALALWDKRIRAVLREHPDAAEWRKEHANLRVLAENAKAMIKKGVPYEVCPTGSEIMTIGSALRHSGDSAARALYQHWRIHRGSGYPVRRTNNQSSTLNTGGAT